MKTGFLFLAALMIVVSSTATLLKTDFSGDWILDQSKSNLGEFGSRMTPAKLTVMQESTIITIVRTSTGQMGEIVTTDKLTFNGIESASTGGMEGSSRKATLKWTDDQQSNLILNAITLLSFNGNSFEVKAKEAWSLDPTGKILTIDAETTTQMGVSTTKLVYNKI